MLTMQRALRSHPAPDHEAVTPLSTWSNHAVCYHIDGARIFGPEAADIRVHPRRGQPDSDLEQNVLKPRAGMIIRLTPELLATLQSPSPKPTVELVLKNAVEGGPLLVVDGVQHKTHSHKMAVGSEVHVVARTEPVNRRGTSVGYLQAEGQAPRKGEQTRTTPSMSIFASLHRKLIVQQVLTAAKRAEIRARKHEIELQEKQAKNKMKRMDDEDGMLAAAESMPLPSPLPSLQPAAASVGVGGWTESQHLKDGKRSRSPSGLGKSEGEDEEDGKRRREQDPLTAWVYDYYRDDSYTGHVSDLRQFFKGIDLQHVMFRYHVLPDGTLEPDRRRFCIKFKTKAGRDLAIGRSGEVLRAAGSSLCVAVAVVRGRNELASGDGDGDNGRVSDFLLALPPGRSVADILKEVRARLPDDLTPALGTPEWAGATPEEKRRFKSSSNRGELDRYNFKSGEHDHLDIRRGTLVSAYHRDMLRAALGATVAEAGALGPQRGAPSARIVGTDEDNSRRVATLAANEAKRELELSWKGVGMMEPNSRGERPQIAVWPGGGARAQRRRILEEG